MCYIAQIMTRRHELLVSTDIVGGLGFPGLTTLIYDKAGYLDYGVEGVGFPVLLGVMAACWLLGLPLEFPLEGVHSRTGQLNPAYWQDNTWLDILKLALIEPVLPDLTNRSDQWVVSALADLGVRDGDLYWLVHDTELDNRATVTRYAAVLGENKMSSVKLAIENTGRPDAFVHAVQIQRQMCDMGVSNVEIVGDIVHYGKSRGVGPRDLRGWEKIWGRMLGEFELAGVTRIHFPVGLDLGDSLDMELMAKWGMSMLSDLGSWRKARHAKVVIECQHGALGVADVDAEIRRQRWLGGVELRAGVIDEENFVQV